MDIDGTLISKTGIISDEDRRALDDARKAGIKISLCTGRVSISCLEILNTLSLDGYHIFFDGALICDSKLEEEVYSSPISAELVNQVYEAALKDSIPLDLCSRTQYFVMKESWRSCIRRTFFGIEATITDFRTLWQRENILKGGIIVSSLEEDRKVRSYSNKFSNSLCFSWTISPACPEYRFINIINKGVSKGIALEYLISHLGIKKEEVIAIGDGLNDLSLLSTAGLAVAMQNSPPDLKSLADYITADAEHCGVAQAIHRFIL